jgi:L-ascorbate metabolism protein UlaG (beta-lactamase superfamily)
MRITKFGHACVRLETSGGTVVVDPGVFATPEALDGVDAVLITHEHFDHYNAELLAGVDVPVFTIEGVAAHLRADAPAVAERMTVVTPGETFTAGGVQVAAVGELHAVIHPDFPRITNSGYLFTADGAKVFHPGDALTGPGTEVDVLLAPVSAPWAKASELFDFIRSVGAPRTVAIHDRIYSEVGSGFFDTMLQPLLGESQSYTRLADGQDL